MAVASEMIKMKQEVVNLSPCPQADQRLEREARPLRSLWLTATAMSVCAKSPPLNSNGSLCEGARK